MSTLFRTRRGRLSLPKIISLSIACLGVLYILLVRGFFPVDIASPWIASALERQLGPGYKVEIGHTRLDHDEAGAPVLRVEEIRVLGPDDKVIASAPRAEVGLDATSFLVGSFRARRINLVGAETRVHVGADGRVAITAGRDASPLTPRIIAPIPEAQAGVAPGSADPADDASPPRTEPYHFPQLARWLDTFEKSGLDGVALAEIGLKQGSLVVESAAAGRTWTFDDINIRLSRPVDGGLLLSVASSSGAAVWDLTATVGAVHDGARAIDVVASNLPPGDILLAAGMGDIDYVAETPLSGILRAQIAQDGRLVSAALRASAGAGTVGRASDPEGRFQIDDLQLQARFDPDRKATIIDPLMIQLGANRFVFTTTIEAPSTETAAWLIAVPKGALFLSSGRQGDPPLVIDRVDIRASYDAESQRLTIQQGKLAGATASGAFSGSITFGSEPMVALGIAAEQMPASAAKRLWPALIAPGTRGWAMDHVEGGVIERILIALNVPLDSIGKQHVELPDSAVRFEMAASGGVFRATKDTPLIRDARVNAVVTGRVARVELANAFVETPNGKRIKLSDGVLEVPNHVPPNPAGSIRFRFDGSAEAVAEILAADPILGNAVGFTAEPATTKGSVSADVRLDLVFRHEMRGDEIDYAAEGELKQFGADGIIHGQRVDGVNARVTVTPGEFQAKGEGQIAGASAEFELRKSKMSADAEFRVTGVLDDASRRRIGVDLAPWLTGPVAMRAQGRTNNREKRVEVETDLGRASVNDLVPGWKKPAGRSAKASFRLVERDNKMKLEDLEVSGSGTTFKGSIELDGEGGFISADLPVFQISDGDKASLRAERTNGGLRVVVRGDVLDARGVVRSMTEEPAESTSGTTDQQRDLDLELRLGAAKGHNGEVARQVNLRLVRRDGRIRSFSLLGRIGRDASLVGELRARHDGSPVLYLTTGDAGALFRFSNFYTRMYGGEAWIVIDPPHPDGAPQNGLLNVSEFVIRGEPGLDRLQSAAPAEPMDRAQPLQRASQGVPFLRMQADFSRTPGRFNIREGLIYGPTIGANVNGVLDFARDRVQLRGTYIPAYGLNNLFGQLPIVGLFLGGPKEGLIAITFEIVGPASGPTLRVNPMSAAAPGFLRKLFEFRGASGVPPAAPIDR